ncbi:MAG: type II secretion system protein [Gemmatimonadales bacterium]|jgi:hypothetical protein
MTMRLREERGGGLVEILIAVVLVSIVLASMMGVLIQQQRFYMVAGDAANTTNRLQMLETVVTPELLPLNPAASDVVYASEDSVVLRAFRGIYWICDKKMLSNAQVTVTTLTDSPPLRRDSAAVYSQGTKATYKDDHWKYIPIGSVAAGLCPDSTAGWVASVPALNGVLSQIPLGAPMRVFKPASYWRVVENGKWVLKTDAISGTPTTIAELAPADSSAASILRLGYVDDEGNPTSTLGDIIGVEIDMLAIGEVPTQRGGRPLSRGRSLYVKMRNADE